jgi:heterotetrameric sarcosine oxidase gamma subunit
VFAPDRRSRFSASSPCIGGAAGDVPLVILERPAAFALVSARKGKAAELATLVKDSLGLALPAPGRSAASGVHTALWVQPDSWLIEGPAERAGTLAAELAVRLAGLASVVDQSHGRSVLRLSGDHARNVLARICRLDTHERAFVPGQSAATLIGHVSCMLHQIDDAPTYDLIVSSTFSAWLLDELTTAATSFGWRFMRSDELTP